MRGQRRKQSFSFAFLKVKVGYAIAETEREPKNALKFCSVEGASINKMRVNQNERHLKESK